MVGTRLRFIYMWPVLLMKDLFNDILCTALEQVVTWVTDMPYIDISTSDMEMLLLKNLTNQHCQPFR